MRLNDSISSEKFESRSSFFLCCCGSVFVVILSGFWDEIYIFFFFFFFFCLARGFAMKDNRENNAGWLSGD
jgi:hypothetical protein